METRKPISAPVASGAPGSGVAPAVASQRPPSQPASGLPVVPAKVAVPLFGGLRGGRPRNDGLKPGSPEALAADKAKNAERMRRSRERAAAAKEPPPLPAAGTAPAGVGSPVTPPPAGQAFQPAFESPVAVLAWSPDMLKEFTDPLIDVIEEGRIVKFTGKAREAKLPAPVVKEIAADVRYPAGAKKTCQIAAPKVAAKWLNKTGVSAEYADEIALLGAAVVIARQGAALSVKLDELIAANKAREKPEPPKLPAS